MPCTLRTSLWKQSGENRKSKAIPHNSKCRYGERGAADAKPKAQIILDAAKVSAASGGNSEPKQGQRSQSARGFCPRSTMRVPQPDIIEHFGNADAVPQPPERCLSRKAGIVRCCLNLPPAKETKQQKNKLIWHPCSRAGVLLHVHTIFTSWQKNDAQFSQIGSILLDSSGVRLPCGGRPPRKGECIH